MSGAQVHVLHAGICETIGEGPVWLEDSGELAFIDILKSKIIKVNAATNEAKHLTVPGAKLLSLAYPTTKKDRFFGLTGHDVVAFDWDAPENVKVLGSYDEGKFTRSNDGHADRAGRLWFGTMGEETAPGVVAPGTGTLYFMEIGDEGCNIKVSDAAPVDLANGIDWTADNRTMVFIDSTKKTIFAFDYDGSTGALRNQRVAIDFAKASEEAGVNIGLPDGCTMDADDKLWVAGYFGYNVCRFDIETGKMIERHVLNSQGITSCAFGGPHMNQLFVTSANRGYENGGSLYRIDGLNARGLAPSKANAPKI